MKKILSLLLVFVFLFAFTACGDSEKPAGETASLKFGMGVISNMTEIASAKGDVNGKANMVTTAAAVLLDKDGKIVDCKIDTMDNALAFTSKGNAVPMTEAKTKYELGDAYGMVAYGGAKAEWYKQVDNFVSVTKGKKLDEVKALAAEDGTPSKDVANAGCTINVADFVKAVISAMENAKDSKATSDNKLKLAFVATQTSSKNADKEVNGSCAVTVDISAVTVDKDNKVTDAKIDTVDGSVAFDTKGVTATKSQSLATKRQLGDNYGMVASGATDKEWYEQVDALINSIIGKNASEISALAAEDGKPNDTLAKAGCTINVLTIVKSVVKAVS